MDAKHMDAHTGSDDGLLRKSIVAVVTIGGGCALFLSVLGTASWLLGRGSAGSDSSKTSTSVEAPSPFETPSPTRSRATPPTDPARKSPTAI